MRPRLALALLLAAACSDDGPPVAAESFCAEWSAAVCEPARACCSRPGGDPAGDCIGARKADCERDLLPFIKDPRTGYNPGRAGRWLTSLRAARAACSTAADAVEGGAESPGFVSAFDGTGVGGADCTPVGTSPSQLLLARLSCGRDRRCRLTLRSTGAPRGTCEAIPPEDRRTVDDLACSHVHDCPEGRWCNLPDPWKPGLWGDCQPPRADGWTCAAPVECKSGVCADPGINNDKPTCLTPTADERYCPLTGDALPPDAGTADAPPPAG